jgi:hypothetical protein
MSVFLYFLVMTRSFHSSPQRGRNLYAPNEDLGLPVFSTVALNVFSPLIGFLTTFVVIDTEAVEASMYCLG